MNAPVSEQNSGQIARRNLSDLTRAQDALSRVVHSIASGV